MARVTGVAVPATTPEQDQESSELLDLLFLALGTLKDRFHDAAAQLGLSPSHAHALRQLGSTMSQRELANCMGYDASNITGIVDGLERQELVERRVDPTDRRVKRLILTERGRQVSEQLQAAMATSSPIMDRLDAADRAEFRRLLAKIADG